MNIPNARAMLLSLERPYTVEKRLLNSLVDFRVISKSHAANCLAEFKKREHDEAIRLNRYLSVGRVNV